MHRMRQPRATRGESGLADPSPWLHSCGVLARVQERLDARIRDLDLQPLDRGVSLAVRGERGEHVVTGAGGAEAVLRGAFQRTLPSHVVHGTGSPRGAIGATYRRTI